MDASIREERIARCLQLFRKEATDPDFHEPIFYMNGIAIQKTRLETFLELVQSYENGGDPVELDIWMTNVERKIKKRA